MGDESLTGDRGQGNESGESVRGDSGEDEVLKVSSSRDSGVVFAGTVPFGGSLAPDPEAL